MSDVTDQLNARVVELAANYERVLVITQSGGAAGAAAIALVTDQNNGIAVATAAILALMTKINTDFPPA